MHNEHANAYPLEAAINAHDREEEDEDGPQHDYISTIRQEEKKEREEHHQTRASTVADEDSNELERSPTHVKQVWKFRMRPADDDEPQDWWFASTAIPLLAATTGPLANVMSIAALVTSWRNNYNPDYPGQEPYSTGYPDPRWCVSLNAVSLVCGFVGNFFLLFNFTRRVRYIVALPMTIIFWYFATAILIAITVAMDAYVPPELPDQLYSQGYWHAVIAAVLYGTSSMLLMVNMLGYFFGHYPQHFELTDEQRNLILQTMMFFFWLAGGAGVFAAVDPGFNFVDSLYYCDVTILTVGFGDYYPENDVGRGLVFPFSVGGIIILGLMVSSINRFAQELSGTNIVKKHMEQKRARTLERSVTSEEEMQDRRNRLEMELSSGGRPEISAPFNPQQRTISFKTPNDDEQRGESSDSSQKSGSIKRSNTGTTGPMRPMKRTLTTISEMVPLKKLTRNSKQPKLQLLREEKDRFLAMRGIQQGTKHFKAYSALTMSVIAFGILWCVGAVVFWRTEQRTQGLSYFEALYFCYVSLLTIGYGDLAPKSNAGKPFFIVWSLIAVPTMTILISDMSDTIIASYKRGTFTLADWTVLPKKGFFREFLEKHPRLLKRITQRQEAAREKKRIANGFSGPDAPPIDPSPTIDELAVEDLLDEHDLARKLTQAIRRTADDLKNGHHHRYTFEEWVEYTRLIRFSSSSDLEEDEETAGIVDWDWIGEDSPMLAEQSEAEWVLDRLCESLDRYMRRQVPEHVKERRKSRAEERLSFNSSSPVRAGGRRGSSFSAGPVARRKSDLT
ncbi:Potassium channel [Agyrium rufum]|nr:Potassium channel [Agyrium rufum]